MNRRILAAGAAVALTALVVVFAGDDADAADRTVTDGFGSRVYLSASAVVEHAQLFPVEDGGCRAWAEGHVYPADGGTPISGSCMAHLSGAAQSECLDIFGAALPFWKNQVGLDSDRIETDADGTRRYLSAGAALDGVDLRLLEDGGCQVEISGYAPREDGGEPFRDELERDLAGANRTRCLNNLTRAKALWRKCKGFGN